MRAEYRRRVAWADTDASTFVHFTAPMKWVEECEHALYREAGVEGGAVRFPRRKVEVDYMRPFFADEIALVRLEVAAAGRTSIGYSWVISRTDSTEASVVGSHTVVHLGDQGTPTPLPERLRRLLVSAETLAV